MKQVIFKSIILLGAFLWVGCSSGPLCSEGQAQIDSARIADLGDIYVDDPENEEKCQDFVDAIRKFVADYRDCDAVDQDSLDEIEQSVSSLPCA